MTELGQVADGLRRAACTVHVDPGVLRARDAPRTPEGYEMSTLIDKPPGAYVAVVRVGEDETVRAFAPQEVVEGPDLVVVVVSGEGEHAVTLGPGGVAQSMQEAVEDATGAGVIAWEQAATDHAGRTGPQGARGLVRSVTQLVDGAEDLLKGLRAEAVGSVGRVGNGLAGHSCSFGDHLNRGPFLRPGNRLLHFRHPDRLPTSSTPTQVINMPHPLSRLT